MWRNGLGEHQAPQADVVGSARSLAMTAREKGSGREKVQHEQRSPHSIAPARWSSQDSGGQVVRQI